MTSIFEKEKTSKTQFTKPDTLDRETIIRLKHADELYKSADSLRKKKKYSDAMKLFEKILRDYPASDKVENAFYWIGECYYAEQKYSIALSYFGKTLENRKSSRKDADAQMMMGECYFKLKNYKQSKAEFQKVVNSYPTSEYVQRAYKRIKDCDNRISKIGTGSR